MHCAIAGANCRRAAGGRQSPPFAAGDLTTTRGQVILLSWHCRGRRRPPSRSIRRTIGCCREPLASVAFRGRNSSDSTLLLCSSSTAGIRSREAPDPSGRCRSAATRASYLPAGSAAALICDTGALIDYLVKSAPDHERFRKAIDQARTRYVPGLVLAEVDYFLRNERRAMHVFLQDLARGRLHLRTADYRSAVACDGSRPTLCRSRPRPGGRLGRRARRVTRCPSVGDTRCPSLRSGSPSRRPVLRLGG